jgi:hypothetical protein
VKPLLHSLLVPSSSLLPAVFYGWAIKKRAVGATLLLGGGSNGPFESPETVGMNPTARGRASTMPNMLSFDTLEWYTGDQKKAIAKFKVF